MSLKQFASKQGMKLMQDPRFMKLAQDPRVMKVAMQAFQARGKVQQSFDVRVAKLAKKLNLATTREVRDLKRTLRKVEQQLEQAKVEAVSKTPDAKPL